MATMEEVRRVKQKYEMELMKKSGVVGCSIGYKHVAGKKTDELCIVCYVSKKRQASELSKEDMIPREIEGVPVDVIESGGFRAL